MYIYVYVEREISIYICMYIYIYREREREKIREGFYFVDNPGVAETLDMRDEGETVGLLPKQELHPGCARSVNKTVKRYRTPHRSFLFFWIGTRTCLSNGRSGKIGLVGSDN